MAGLSPEHKLQITANTVNMFRMAFRQGSQFADDMRLINSDAQRREYAAQVEPEMMASFEKMTSGEVVTDAEVWPIAKAVAEAAVYAAEAIFEERERNRK